MLIEGAAFGRRRFVIKSPAMPVANALEMENTAFVVRISWDHAGRIGLIVVKPVDDGPLRAFADLESAIFYLSQLYTKS